MRNCITQKASQVVDLQGFMKSGRLDLNQRPLRPERMSSQSQLLLLQELMESLSAVCSRICTNNPNAVHVETLETLADALRDSLPREQFRHLVELLNGAEEPDAIRHLTSESARSPEP